MVEKRSSGESGWLRSKNLGRSNSQRKSQYWGFSRAMPAPMLLVPRVKMPETDL